MQIGEAIVQDIERREERGLIRADPLPSGLRRILNEELARLRARMFSGFALSNHGAPAFESALPYGT